MCGFSVSIQIKSAPFCKLVIESKIHLSSPVPFLNWYKLLGKRLGPIQSKFGYHIFVITEEEQMIDTCIDGLTGTAIGAGDGTL